MDDSRFVRFLERLRNLPGNGERFGERDRAPPNPLLQGLAGHELHHQEVAAVRFLDAVDGGNVWMIQGRQHARFALEPGDAIGVVAERFGQELDRNRATELRVGGLIDLAHPARAEVRRDFVVCEPCSDHVGGVNDTAGNDSDAPAENAHNAMAFIPGKWYLLPDLKGVTSIMRSLNLWLLTALVVVGSLSQSSALQVAQTGQGPAMASIGPLAFGPDGTLFAADNQNAAIFALDLGAQANGGAPGAKGLDAVNEKLAALLGTGAAEVDRHRSCRAPAHAQCLRVGHARPGRGRRTGAVPHRRRRRHHERVAAVAEVPARRAARTRRPPTPTARQNPRTQVVTDMAFADGRLWVAGLSNEEFASKLRAIPYPFASVDRGTSVEIYHGNHRALETRSPVNAFVPYTLNNQPHLIAGYTCTPLVKFPIADLKPGEKVRGTTIAEFGAGNRVLDMIVYRKGGAGIPAHRQQQPRRHEDPDEHVRDRGADHDAGRDRNRRRAVREGGEHDGHPAARQARRQQLDRDRAGRPPAALNLQVVPLP